MAMGFVGSCCRRRSLWQALMKRAADGGKAKAPDPAIWWGASAREEVVRGSSRRRIGSVSEGLSSLLLGCERRADAMIVRRSFHRGGTSVVSGIGRGRDWYGGAAGIGRVLLLNGSVGFSSSPVKKQIGEVVVVVQRRNLSLETWAQRWNKASEQVKKAVNVKPKAAGAAAGLKLGSGSREFLSQVSRPVQTTLSRYREAVGLQAEAFWKRNYLVVVAVVGLGVCLLLWRLMFGVASTFISMSEGLAKFGFLALAAAMVIVSGVVLRARFIINPDAVYRVAMRKLNTSAAVLEVMGAPLSGTDIRAYIMSGGGLRIKNFRPRIAGKRCFIIFPIRGSERRGLVSIEVKKKKGQYDFKLLAVDVPTAGDDQRLYLIGDEREYKVGGGLISELRDPMVTAMMAQKEFEELDMREEEEEEREEERKAVEAANLQAAELNKLEMEERKAVEAAELNKLEMEQAQDASEKLEEPKSSEDKALNTSRV